MKKIINILLLSLAISFGLKAQTQLPSVLPNPKSPTSFYWIGWLKGDSGIINAVRDTLFTPRYPGTQVVWQHAGTDTLLWWWTGQRWLSPATSGGGGGGNFSSFSFTNQNGITGTVTQATGPNVNLALGTNLNGIVNANGTGFGTVTIGAGLTYVGNVLSANTGTALNALISGNGSTFIATNIGAGLSYNTSTHTLTNTIVNNNQLINGAGYITNITGLVTAGSNVTITGNGTSGTPYVINASAGGSVVGAGNLSPLFTTSTSAGTINFAFQNPSAFTIFGNPQGVSAAPMYFGINSTLAFVGNILGVSTSAPLNFYQTIAQIDSFTFTLNTPTGRHDTVRIHLPTNGFISTLNNGLTLTGTNGQLGGPLVQNTLINGGGFSLGIQGNRFATGMGASIVAANNLTTGSDGNLFQVTGLTQINAITTTNWQNGSEISFIFTSTPILKNNTAGGGGTAPMFLAGSIDYQAAPGDYIKFQYDGIAWHEETRKLASAGGAYIFSNGLTESPATRVKLGGTLTQNTTLAGASTFYIAINGGRFQTGAGAAIVAANNLLPGNDGNQFSVTGNTQINAISTLNWQAGPHIELIFTGTPLLKNNTAGGVNTAVMLLAGSVDYQAAPGDLIGFSYDGTNWHETNRKLAGSVTNLTFNNGLTLTGTTAQLGGTLIQNTTVTGGLFTMNFTGSHTTNQVVDINNTSSGIAAKIEGTSGEGAVISTLTGFAAADFDVTPATTNTLQRAINIFRGSSGTAAAGMGTFIGYQLKDNTNVIEDAGAFSFEWEDATHANFTSEFRLKGVTAGGALADWVTADGAGLYIWGTQYALYSPASTLGVQVTASSNAASFSSPGSPLFLQQTDPGNNTIKEAIRMTRGGSGAGVAGLGVAINAYLVNGSSGSFPATSITSRLVTATAGSEAVAIDFATKTAGGSVTSLTLKPNGVWNAPQIATWGNFANNAAAITGGLVVGDLYRNGDVVQIVH